MIGIWNQKLSAKGKVLKKKIKSYRNFQNVFMHIKIDVLDFIQKTCMLD
jgi:hypothetical protein